MNIVLTDVGILYPTGQIKFILLDDGRLFLGRVKWHKDLADAVKLEEAAQIVGAGTVLSLSSEDDQDWGNWKSSGFGVVTPHELRNLIKRTIREHSKNL